MIYFWRTLKWTVVVYVAGWFAKFVLELDPYWLITRGHFLIPPVSVLVFLSICLCPLGRNMPKRKAWVIFAVLALLLNSYLSWGAWKFYLIQDDAPMGIIPDLNALACLFADFLFMGLIFSVVSLDEKVRRRGKERVG